MKTGELELEGKLTGVDAPTASGLAGGDLTMSGGVGAGSATAAVGLAGESILDDCITGSRDGVGPAASRWRNYACSGGRTCAAVG